MLPTLPPSDWSLSHAGHLLSRAGFGGTPAEIRALHARGFPGAVTALINGDEDADLFPSPAWADDPRSTTSLVTERLGKPTTPEEKREVNDQARKIERERSIELLTGWFQRMAFTTHPLREKLTLFWHDHFATSNQKVQDAYFMWVQNETLRARAFGRFDYLAKEISRDPAMMKWLDLNRSETGKPNENFARELLELFTLGEGNYSEDDIKAAARAFTGYRVDGPNRTFKFHPKRHDSDPKTFLGRTGRFDGDDIIDLAVADPHCAPFLARKLWEFFVSENPPAETVDTIADTLRRHNLEIAPALTGIFQSREFYAPSTRRSQIKCPVQWLVQTCKALEIPPPGHPILTGALAQLGQIPFVPPNVGGWEWGRSWINSTTLILRCNLAGFLTGISEQSVARIFPARERYAPALKVIAPPELRKNPEALADELVLRLYASNELPALRQRALDAIHQAGSNISDDDLRRILHHLMSAPEFQLT